MSPWEAGADALLTVTDAGSKSGRERKCSRPPAAVATVGMSPAGSWLPGLEIPKLNVPFGAVAIGRCVATVTVSPGVNALLGRKLTPWPSEVADQSPGMPARL